MTTSPKVGIGTVILFIGVGINIGLVALIGAAFLLSAVIEAAALTMPQTGGPFGER